MKITIESKEIISLMSDAPSEFPKYTTQLINLANQNAQGTRPTVVGQLSEMIQEFTGRTIEEWRDWYIKEKPDAIQQATERIWKMVQNLKLAIEQVDREMVERWVNDLVIVKTFVGLKFQEAVLKKVAHEAKQSYRLAEPEEESKGIDGFIGKKPVSIKPITYKAKGMLGESIEVKIIYYQKTKEGISLELEPWWRC